MRAVERRHHGEVDDAAGRARELLARPDLSPAVLGDELLQRAGEVVGGREGTIDILVADHRAADLEAGFIGFCVRHAPIEPAAAEVVRAYP